VSDARDLTGFWSGEYRYDLDGGRVPFLARLSDDGGAVSGEVFEPNTVGTASETLRALVDGRRDGSDVRFAKTYDGASDMAHRVDYHGTLSADGLTLAGFWTLEGWRGSFSMQRAELPAESRAAMAAEDAELQETD
jgi:hypothetical protein